MVPCFSALALIKVVGLPYSNFIPWRRYLSNLQPIENNSAIPICLRTLLEYHCTSKDVLVIDICK